MVGRVDPFRFASPFFFLLFGVVYALGLVFSHDNVLVISFVLNKLGGSSINIRSFRRDANLVIENDKKKKKMNIALLWIFLIWKY